MFCVVLGSTHFTLELGCETWSGLVWNNFCTLKTCSFHSDLCLNFCQFLPFLCSELLPVSMHPSAFLFPSVIPFH